MRRFKTLLVVIVGVLLGSTAAWGAPADSADVVATLEQGYASLRDLRASFTQQAELASVKRVQRGAGELYLKKSDGTVKFRFNYTKPKQQIVSDGKTVWYYLPENRQVMTMDAASLFAGGGGIALSYLTGIGHLSQDFSVRLVGSGRDAKGNYLLELIPKKQGQAFTKLQLAVAGKVVDEYRRTGKVPLFFPIVSSVVFDQLGNRTAIDFSRVRVNGGVSASHFNFTVPAGVEVVRSPLGGK
ncbi:outer-membrane lipoprotein carrier protein [Geotalea uraniireducens]|uniref:Outer-membrane lipoprotein carrier protein n=1 Tax=Geotalea uraniireducens TaxID=351604 RepID=A0ABN6VQS7_9BACT|nr:outer membrane lipoprotein carrier protein LolA [Geotalea uraniireducens]BDV41360.1 outer-membrane lipoprotein carrier protein [Geotalea uraniireducens]